MRLNLLHLVAAHARKAAMLALGACATLGAARADVITLWATSVPETSSPASTTPWTNEGYAALAPTCNNCNTTTSCQYATNAVNSNTTPLSAVDFGNFVLPTNHRIVRVQADVQCRHNENTTATVGFRAYAPAHGIDSGWRTSPAFNSIAVGGVYICADRLAGTGDITGITTNWTAAKVNDLQLQVRRQAGLTSNTLRVLAMKLVVTTEPNPAAPTVPNTPTNLRTTAATTNSIALAWNDNASNETGYVLYQLAPGLDPAVISNWITVNLPVNATSTTRTGLTAGSTYRFHVRAINAAGLGAQSNTLAATTVAPPAGSQFFINELRMTGGGDSYIEVVAPAGTVLDGNYRILKLNGGPNAQYAGTLENSRTFVGNPTVANMGGGMGVARVGYLGLQAGERAGYAFVRYQGTQVQVLDFVTYRGGSANAGPVTSKVPGMVGAVGPVLPYSLLGAPNTLRLVGSGCHRGYFQWALVADDAEDTQALSKTAALVDPAGFDKVAKGEAKYLAGIRAEQARMIAAGRPRTAVALARRWLDRVLDEDHSGELALELRRKGVLELRLPLSLGVRDAMDGVSADGGWKATADGYKCAIPRDPQGVAYFRALRFDASVGARFELAFEMEIVDEGACFLAWVQPQGTPEWKGFCLRSTLSGPDKPRFESVDFIDMDHGTTALLDRGEDASGRPSLTLRKEGRGAIDLKAGKPVKIQLAHSGDGVLRLQVDGKLKLERPIDAKVRSWRLGLGFHGGDGRVTTVVGHELDRL